MTPTLKTALTELVGVEYPIVQTGMAGFRSRSHVGNG